MAFYHSTPLLKPLEIGNGEYQLRPPLATDYESWHKVRESSREFLVPWEPKWPPNDLSRLGFRRRLKRYGRERELKIGETYFLVNCKNNEVLGGISISNIRYGVAQTCSIGYWMGAEFAGQGHMGKVVLAICKYIFEELSLHRIEAACLLDNTRSSRLLLSAGFKREGIVRQYLEINGARQDHELYSILRDEFMVESRPFTTE